jgi:hypothetical protein
MNRRTRSRGRALDGSSGRTDELARAGDPLDLGAWVVAGIGIAWIGSVAGEQWFVPVGVVLGCRLVLFATARRPARASNAGEAAPLDRLLPPDLRLYSLGVVRSYDWSSLARLGWRFGELGICFALSLARFPATWPAFVAVLVLTLDYLWCCRTLTIRFRGLPPPPVAS